MAYLYCHHTKIRTPSHCTCELDLILLSISHKQRKLKIRFVQLLLAKHTGGMNRFTDELIRNRKEKWVADSCRYSHQLSDVCSEKKMKLLCLDQLCNVKVISKNFGVIVWRIRLHYLELEEVEFMFWFKLIVTLTFLYSFPRLSWLVSLSFSIIHTSESRWETRLFTPPPLSRIYTINDVKCSKGPLSLRVARCSSLSYTVLANDWPFKQLDVYSVPFGLFQWVSFLHSDSSIHPNKRISRHNTLKFWSVIDTILL